MSVLLSSREVTVLHMVAEGFTDQQIAYRLRINERTSRRNIEKLYSKLGAVNRPNVIHRAWQEGILK